MTARGDRGAAAVEYGLLLAAIAAVVVAVVFALGTEVSTLFGDTAACLAAGEAGTVPCTTP